MRLIALGVTFVLACLAWAAPAHGEPLKESYDVPFAFVDESICGFPIQMSGRQTGEAIFFFDHDGDLRRINDHGTEQMTMTANGRTVTVDPFPYNFHILFENGQIEHIYLSGLVFRLRLPDGSLFLSAGRVDFVEENANFLIVPADGRSGDVASLCRALSG